MKDKTWAPSRTARYAHKNQLSTTEIWRNSSRTHIRAQLRANFNSIYPKKKQLILPYISSHHHHHHPRLTPGRIVMLPPPPLLFCTTTNNCQTTINGSVRQVNGARE
jgi:hypothetical protein